PTVNAGPDRTVQEGGPVSLIGLATDVPADVLTYRWHVESSNGQVTADGNQQNFAFTPNDNGVYSLTFTATDDDGGTTSDTVVSTALNVAPTVSITGPATGVRGQARNFIFTATDPSSADVAAGFSYAVKWGDGSPVQSITSPGTSTVASHTFLQCGTYKV